MNLTHAELTKYPGAVSVLHELPAEVVVPPAWQGLLGASAPDKIRSVIALWEQHYSHEFSAQRFSAAFGHGRSYPDEWSAMGIQDY